MGEVVGAVLMLAVIAGLFVFFIIALIRAAKTGRSGWIITASILGLPVAALAAGILFSVVFGVIKAASPTASSPGSATGATADLLGDSMTPVPGTVIPYQMSYPQIDSWKKLDTSDQAFDQLFNFRDEYIGVIAEGIGVGTPQRVCDLSQKNLVAKSSKYSFTPAQPIQIDSHSWLTFDATATVSGVDFKYRFYVYSDSKFTFQIVSWAVPADFDTFNPVFDRVAKSFQLPK